MDTVKPNVTIKGTKDGLTFYLDDRCAYDSLIDELKEKLNIHPQFLNGPLLQVKVHLGNRYLTSEQEDEIKDVIRRQGNLVVEKIESLVVPKTELEKVRLESEVKMVFKTIRSGQVVHSEGHLLILGDVNPGGTVQAGGHIFIIGALRGVAHAGIDGNRGAIIAASLFYPTQLRIASVISRPPDDMAEDDIETYEREFAYVEQGQICLEKLNQLVHIRPDLHALYAAFAERQSV